ncbi:MAG: hypothetical protein AAFN76_05420 [Pseudomonadota bacterium]
MRTFPRVLGRYVYELRLLDLAQAIHKITGKSAETFGLQNPGFIKPEFVADLVLFDPDTVSDFADYDRPELPSAGIICVRRW